MKPVHALLLSFSVALSVAGCNAPTEATCQAASDCDACLAIDGCNWTASQCSNECLQDTSCYGPGNPSAAECPSGED